MSRAIASGICWAIAIAVFVIAYAQPPELIDILQRVAVYALFGGAAAVGALYVFHAVREGLRHSSPRVPR